VPLSLNSVRLNFTIQAEDAVCDLVHNPGDLRVCNLGVDVLGGTECRRARFGLASRTAPKSPLLAKQSFGGIGSLCDPTAFRWAQRAE